MDGDVIRRRVVVEGRVQGVFFRDSCRREATTAGVAGWARNLGDGRVVVVEGRVQGVFFRDSCRREATTAGVAGWARNLGDGRVEVVAEGAPEAVERLVHWCRRGPSRAVVTNVHVGDERPEGLRGFSVR